MSEKEKRNSSDGFEDIAELDLSSYDEMTSDDSDNKEVYADALGSASSSESQVDATYVDANSANDDNSNDEANFADEGEEDMDGLSEEESAAAVEFNAMDNVINGKKRKPRKKKKKMSKRGKMIEYVAIACVCVALLSVIGYFLNMLLNGETKTQALTGADVTVDMTDCDYYFGTVNTIDLTKTFPGGTGFALGEGLEPSCLKGSNLTIPADSGVETFVLNYNAPATTEGGAVTAMTVTGRVVEGGVNTATWDDFRKNAKEEKIIVLHDNISSIYLQDLKRKDHPSIVVKNDIYGNGKIVNLFEIVCTRTKVNSKKFGEPYRRGNGKVWGDDGIRVQNKTENPNDPVVLQDVHFTGNDMSQADEIYEGGEDASQTPVADGDAPETERKLLKAKGNLNGLSDADIAKRGVLLFSKYGAIVNVSASEGDVKTNCRINHCVIENGGKVLHISNSNVDIEGTIVRNAADTAISIRTAANSASTIHSKNNVIANSLTGGILFYSFENIAEADVDTSWNHFYIDGFLDIYNWKEQSSLAFLPETEDFASIANPIAASEIPKKEYDKMKGVDEQGNLYIHFAIIKIRTGAGVKQNGSEVHGYQEIGYDTSRGIGFEKGFPIPSLASAIMKDIDVWGYYGNSKGDVPPGKVLGGESEEDLKLFYKELREGRIKGAETEEK